MLFRSLDNVGHYSAQPARGPSGDGFAERFVGALDNNEFRLYYQPQIGRESCRERVCQYVSISVVAVPLKKKIRTPHQTHMPIHHLPPLTHSLLNTNLLHFY